MATPATIAPPTADDVILKGALERPAGAVDAPRFSRFTALMLRSSGAELALIYLIAR